MIWYEFDMKLIMVNLFLDFDGGSLTEKAKVRDRGATPEASGEDQVTYTKIKLKKQSNIVELCSGISC